MFSPEPENPYLQVATDDEDTVPMDEIVTNTCVQLTGSLMH